MCFCIFYTFLKKVHTFCIFQQKLHKNHVPWGKQLVVTKNFQTISCRYRLSKKSHIFNFMRIYNHKNYALLLLMIIYLNIHLFFGEININLHCIKFFNLLVFFSGKCSAMSSKSLANFKPAPPSK